MRIKEARKDLPPAMARRSVKNPAQPIQYLKLCDINCAEETTDQDAIIYMTPGPVMAASHYIVYATVGVYSQCNAARSGAVGHAISVQVHTTQLPSSQIPITDRGGGALPTSLGRWCESVYLITYGTMTR